MKTMMKWAPNSDDNRQPQSKTGGDYSNGSAEGRSYLHQLTRKRLLSFEEEVELSALIQAGNTQARDRLVEANMRLVINIARSYRTSLIPIEDLIQEGAIGLMTAAERFDPSKGYRFSTYATHWIRQSISRAIDNKSKAIRIPAHVSESLRKIERIRTAYTRERGEDPTTEYIAQELGTTVRKVNLLLQANQEPVSLDMLVGDEDSASLASLLNDVTAENPQDAVITAEIQEILNNLLQILTPREREVMSQRMGFEGDAAHVLQEIGENLQISRERVRQIELQALRKLKYAARRRDLFGYISE